MVFNQSFYLLLNLFIGYIAIIRQNGYGAWIFTYLTENKHITEIQAGIWTSLYWLGFTVFRFFGIFIAIYVSPLRIILFHTLLLVVTLLAIILFNDNIPFFFIANLVLGAALSVLFPCIVTYCGSNLNIPPKKIGNLFISALAGGMIGPWIMGQLFVVDTELIFSRF